MKTDQVRAAFINYFKKNGHTPVASSRLIPDNDPDVILIGEMRDLETIQIALLAAETGHLVLSTLHTLDAQETVNRIVASFPANQQL